MKLMFNRADQPLTPFLYIDGWKRHFTYFSDWVHQLELFQRMSFNDQVGRGFLIKKFIWRSL